jgi:hypothetical protein
MVVQPYGEPHVAREYIEAFVVLCVAVLRRTGSVRGKDDFTDSQAMIGVTAVFEDPDLRRTAGDEFALAGADDRYLNHEEAS